MTARRLNGVPSKGTTILVCEDEALLLGTLARDLSREGYEVLQADSGEAALELLSRHHVDLVITDLKLPGINGCTLLGRARATRKPLPAIVMSAYGNESLDRCVPQCEGCTFLDKPFSMATLRSEVQRTLSGGYSPERKVGI